MSSTERLLLWVSTLASILCCALLIADLRLHLRPPADVTHRQSVLPLPADFTILSVEELAMRFRFPDSYPAEAEHHPIPKGEALAEMLRRGLIRRGIRTEEAEFLLGEPYNTTPDVPLLHMNEWLYGLGGGNLVLQFTEAHQLSSATQTHDGLPEHASKTEDLLGHAP